MAVNGKKVNEVFGKHLDEAATTLAAADDQVNWSLLVALIMQAIPELLKLLKKPTVMGAHDEAHVKEHADCLVKKAACLYAEAAVLRHELECCEEESTE